jgi:hypothetical protein
MSGQYQMPIFVFERILMRKLLPYSFLFFLSANAVAQTGGTSSFQILHTISPARVAALGGNSLAVKDGDLNLGLIAPSLLDSTAAGQVVFGYTRFFGEANISHVGYAHQAKGLGTLSFGIQSLGYGDFDMTDEAGNITGSFNAGEYLFQGGIARQLDEHFSIGANVKYIFSQLAEYKATALAIDAAGTYYNQEKHFTATFMLKNIGSQLSSYRPGVDENIPFEIQAGISKKLDKAPIRFSLIGENLQTWDLTPESNDEVIIDPLTGEETQTNKGGFGENLARHLLANAEIILTENLHVRIGYNYNRRQQLKIEERPGGAGITWGFGFRVSKFHLSYGRAAYSLAGVSNHFNVSVRFDDFKKS